MSFEFAPDQKRTAHTDQAVRQSFVASVDAVLSAARRIDVDADDPTAWKARIAAARRVPPQTWACYHDLVQAALRDDTPAVARLAAELLAGGGGACEPGHVVTVAARDLGAIDAERYIRIIDSDGERPLALQPASAADVSRVAALAVEARDLLAEADADLLDEIDTLGHQIVLATGAARGFGGAASVFLWGAVVLNPTRIPDRVTLVESLSHECAHALLFGLTLGADLTTNDPAERYASPLRPDPRPIEGIVHATYVLARMNYALQALSKGTGLSDCERAQIGDKLKRNRTSYESGLATSDAHARFTAEGAEIFEACRRAMADTMPPLWLMRSDPV